MRAYPFILRKGASGRNLEAIREGEKQFDESWLQEVLRKQPDILPVREIEPVFGPPTSIGREVGTDAGTIDNLFISSRGYLTIVETKLWRNPQARREVVAQIMDYANALTKWSYKKLNASVREYTRQYNKVEMSLVELVEKEFDSIEGDPDFFIETVEKNLRLGRFLALIVGDRIRESAVEVAKYVSKQPGLALNLALVELQCYRLMEGKNWPLIVVPRVVKQTQIVERSIVQVTVVEGEPPQVEIQQEKAEEKEKKRVRRALTEEAFWELFEKHSSEHLDAAKKLIDVYRNKPGIEIDSAESSVVAKIDFHETGQLIQLFFVNKNADVVVWPIHIAHQLQKAGFDAAPAQKYGERIRVLLQTRKSLKQYSCSIGSLDIERFTREVDKFLHALGEAEPVE